MIVPFDATPPVSAREQAVGLQHLVSLANGGSSGLALLLSSDSKEDVGDRLKEGVDFLRRVLIDVSRYRQGGVDPWSDDVNIPYPPQLVLHAFIASTFTQRDTDGGNIIDIAATELEQTARGLLQFLTTLVESRGIDVQKEILHQKLEEYLKIVAPYLRTSIETTEDFKRGTFARPLNIYYSRGPARSST